VALVQLEPGTLFAGDYLVVGPLCHGGMGAVYVAIQQSTGARRALKIMLPELVASARHRRRFEQEARIGARIESDHVVHVIGAGIDAATGTPWLAMELLRGEDLASLMAARGPLPVREVVAVLEQLCHALGAAHRVGIVHRDLKPENVFIGAARRPNARSEVKILDFGISKMMAEAFTTGTGNIGSPMWMAPEQTNQGDPVGPPADVWSLGLLTFYLLTGVFFWHAANTDAPVGALLREIVLKDVPSASRRAREYGVEDLLPPRFDEWFARCVDRDASARFENASVAYAVFWAILKEPGPPAAGLEDDTTAVDFSDQKPTLSSIPPAVPRDPEDSQEITVDDQPSVVRVRRRLDYAAPSPSFRTPSPDLARRPVKLETGAGTSHSTPPARAAAKRARWLVAGTALALLTSAAFVVPRTPRPSSAALAQASLPLPGEAKAAPEAATVPPFALKMVTIPAGSFAPGTAEGAAGARPKVMIDAFAIAETEVTVASWIACVAARACPSLVFAAERTSPECNFTLPPRLEHPVNCVTWAEAEGFCAWARGRLPSEDEWEYAAAGGREGRVNPYPWGAALSPLQANARGDEDGYPFTAPGGRFPHGASEFNVLDMAGNVAEWTASLYSPPRPMKGVTIPDDLGRVTRGGSYVSELRELRTSVRGRADPGLRAPTLGFRCVRAPR
jgi:formylglycine-generating enzyme required for sulfatase activity/serine/threonine protein kinase